MLFSFAQWLARQDNFVFSHMIILSKTVYKLNSSKIF